MDRYEEALEKARAEYEKARKQGYTWLMGLLEGMFPDLKESEEERIRKELIEQVGYIIPDKEEYDNEGRVLPTYHKRIGRYRAWLEKQKTSEEAIRYVKENHSPDEVSDFQVAMNIAVTKAYDKGVQDTLEKQKAQQSVEWSEEDKEMVRRAIFYTEQYRTNYGDTKESEECFNWLLDLHRNIRPPFHWKPSEEQMGTLKQWLQDHELDGDSRYVYPIFYSLFADLQKLL